MRVMQTSMQIVETTAACVFGVEPGEIAKLAQGDAETLLRRSPDLSPEPDIHDGLDTFLRRTVAICLAMRSHRGAMRLLTERQARATGWRTARLANMAAVLGWALSFWYGHTGFVRLLVEAYETAMDAAPLVTGAEALPDFDTLFEALNAGTVSAEAAAWGDESGQERDAEGDLRLVRLDELVETWLGIDVMAVELPTDRRAPKMDVRNGRALQVLAWLINESIDLGCAMRRESVDVVRVKTDPDALIAEEPGAAAANLALLLASAISYGRGSTLQFLPPRDRPAAALIEDRRRVELEYKDVAPPNDVRTVKQLELQDLVARGYIHVGRTNIARVASRLHGVVF